MPYERLLHCLKIALVGALVWIAVFGRCDAAVREYAVISIKIGTAASTPVNTGTLVFELWPDLAPKTVQNFKHLANTGFYDGTASHRLIKNFMVQAGDPLTRNAANVKSFGSGDPGYKIPDELAKITDATWEKRRHVRGVLSMAHSNNPAQNIFNTGGSQFFVMFGTADYLDGVHSTFGTLTSGSEFLQVLENCQTSSKQTATLDLNDTGAFEDIEKQLILQTFNGTEAEWGTTWKGLFGKSSDQELTEAERSFIASAMAGFTDINQDGALTYDELNDPLNSAPLVINQPIERIAIQSIQVFGIDDSPTAPIEFKSATYSGLLRPPDRSQVVGRYNVSVHRSGSYSAVVEYLARRTSFSGKFDLISGTLLNSSTIRMAVAQETMDAKANSPLGLEMKLQKAFSPDVTKNSISVAIALVKSGTLVIPLAFGFSESASTLTNNSLLAYYTSRASVTNVSEFIPTKGWQKNSSSIGGTSHFVIRTNPALRLSYLSGRLANGVPFTTSRILSMEHGANILPVYSYSLPAFLENQRAAFSSLDLFRSTSTPMDSISLDELTFLNSRSLVFGSIPVADKTDTSESVGSLLWMHPQTTQSTASLRSRYAVTTECKSAPWTAPTANAVMKPFSTLTPRGQLLVNGNTLNFTVSNNIIATFQQPTSTLNPFLRFDPRTGEFSGYFFEVTPSVKRRVFSGVLLNSTNANGGFGFYLDANSSRSVRIIPVTP
jgi:peptidyl-prolyl cis-trans isomerase B (cyclophilin B)